LESAIRDLQALQQVLHSGDLDAGILADFRDALNRIRNIAWAAQQLVASQVSDQGPESVNGLLASERIRATYQLCRAIGNDLTGDGIQFKRGQLSELHLAVTELAQQLKDKLES
jgi:two-component sensor histidine kinase